VEDIVFEKVKCPKCSYVWYTRSKRLYIVCPNCHYTFKKRAGIGEKMRWGTDGAWVGLP